MKNKMLTIMLVLLVAITLVGVIALVVVMKFSDESASAEQSIEQVLEQTVEVSEITTNLMDNDIIRISFMVETNSKKAKEELEKRDFQIRNIIIEELSETKAEQLSSKQGKSDFLEKVQVRSNELMQSGKIKKIYITSSILQ